MHHGIQYLYGEIYQEAKEEARVRCIYFQQEVIRWDLFSNAAVLDKFLSPITSYFSWMLRETSYYITECDLYSLLAGWNG